MPASLKYTMPVKMSRRPGTPDGRYSGPGSGAGWALAGLRGGGAHGSSVDRVSQPGERGSHRAGLESRPTAQQRPRAAPLLRRLTPDLLLGHALELALFGRHQRFLGPQPAEEVDQAGDERRSSRSGG